MLALSRRPRTTVLVALASLTVARAASAGNLDDFGLGARPSGMGGAFTALASDWTATYYNPAGLVGSKHVNVGGGFSYAGYALDFKSERGGSQVDDRATREDPLSEFNFGISNTIALDEPDRIGVGIGLFIPTRKVVEVRGKTPSAEPDWALYGTNADRLHVLPGFAVKITDGLSFGAAMDLFAVAEGDLQFAANLSSPVSSTFDLELKPDVGGIFGIFFQPMNSLSFGLTYRTERSFKVKFPVLVNVQGILLPLTTERITLFDPHQVAFGAAWNPFDGPFVVCLDVTYMNWSANRETFQVISSPTFPVGPRLHSQFDDTVVARAGFEWTVNDLLALRAGYMYRPSPAPDPTGPTTLLDCDAHVFTLGGGLSWSFDRPRLDAKNEKLEKPAPSKGDAKKDTNTGEKDSSKPEPITIDVDFFAQYHYLVTRTVERPDPTDPLGRIEFGGFIWDLGISVQARF